MNIDFYSAFRSQAYNSEHPDLPLLGAGIAGQFDPMNGVIYLRDHVARALDTSGIRPRSSVEEAGSEEFVHFSTYLHEMIHWWQHVGTTSGAMYGLSIPMQALATAKYLNETGVAVRKPMVQAIDGPLPHDHPALLAVRRWTEIEHGASILYDPELAAFTLGQDTLLYHSMGRALLLLYTSTIAGMARVFDEKQHGLPNISRWIDLCHEFEAARRPCFAQDEIITFPVGMRQIAEGQARVSEIQYRCLTHKATTWAEVKACGLLSGIYGTAFHEFLRLSGRSEPEHPTDDSVHLFLLICDVALNPSEGYATDIEPDGEFVHRVHPGIRFMRLCRAAEQNDGLERLIRPLTHDAYGQAAKALCDRLEWLTPDKTAEAILNRLGRMSGINTLDAQESSGDYGAEDVPLRFFMSQHRSILETRLGLPHLFCWPAAMLTAYRGRTDKDLELVQQIVDEHLPPFLASSLETGVDTLQASIPAEKQGKFLTEYFATQVLYDLARQWISRRGPFTLNYRWKPRLEVSDRDRLALTFQQSFGVPFADIPVS